MIIQYEELNITYLLFKIQILKYQTKFKAVISSATGEALVTATGEEFLLYNPITATDLYTQQVLIDNKLPDLLGTLLSQCFPKHLGKKDLVDISQNFCSYIEFFDSSQTKDRSEKFGLGLGYVDDTETLTPQDVLTIKVKILLPYFEKKK